MSGEPAPASAPSSTGSKSRRSKILRRTRVGGTLAVAVAGLLWAASLPAGPAITLALAVVVTLWSIFEVQRMGLFSTQYGAPAAVVACFAGAGLFARAFITADGGATTIFDGTNDVSSYWAILAVALLGGFVAGGAAVLPALFGVRDRRNLPAPEVEPVSHALLLAAVALPLLALVPVRAFGGIAALSCYLVLAKIGDIAGYYFGSLMGRRHPFPNISPNKTVAGCVASLIAGTAIGGLFVLLGVLGGARFGVLSGLLLGAVINVTAQAGDLLESALKRRAKVKDSGTTFGPSGGMLDLVDSLLLSAPLTAFLWPVLFDWPA